MKERLAPCKVSNAANARLEKLAVVVVGTHLGVDVKRAHLKARQQKKGNSPSKVIFDKTHGRLVTLGRLAESAHLLEKHELSGGVYRFEVSSPVL